MSDAQPPDRDPRTDPRKGDVLRLRYPGVRDINAVVTRVGVRTHTVVAKTKAGSTLTYTVRCKIWPEFAAGSEIVERTASTPKE